MSTIKIEPADPDSDIAAELIHELSADLGARYDDSGEGGFKPEDVTVDRAAFVIAWVDDAAVGCGALRPMDEQTAEIKRMDVRPSHRGKGISRDILTCLEEIARGFGYHSVKLETGVLQPEAVALYYSSGYHSIPCYEHYIDDPRSVCFEKSLD